MNELRSAERGFQNKGIPAFGRHSVYKTFGRSYDRIYRMSGLRPDGLRFYVGSNLCVRSYSKRKKGEGHV